MRIAASGGAGPLGTGEIVRRSGLYRGLGIGGKLADAVIELARQKSALRLYLESNRILEAAIRNCARNPQANEPVSAGRPATMPFAGRTPGRIELR
ncbi:GNAT family N-acetyltransferase [Victivallis sp. Marseille-Q1083]|uniref:GNAT family N-acetyltransferase n=1 Tax=Victivallis sp. Marseille-Q1083 TaxID=2717288 RepID=UPI00158AC475|nr:GNAT family N-acetyltransferase [Victivallis sp. Marseille-Q1083]